MRSLDQARAVCESYLPGLLDGLAGIAFERREAPGGATLPIFRASHGPALVIPRDYGGLGASPLEAVRVMRAVAAAAPSLAVASTMHHFSVATLFAFADSVHKSGMEWALLEAITTNDLLVASGFAEGRSGQGILAPTMRAVPAPGGYLLNGAKKPCSLSHSMDLLTASVALTVPGEQPETAFVLLPATLPGISRHPFWASRVLAGAESDELRLTDVRIEEELLIRTDQTPDGALDDLQTVGYIWFELLISAAYLGMASTLVERALSGRRGSPSELALAGVRLETATQLLEGTARVFAEGAADNEGLATALVARYGMQDAIADASRQAVELLGGMAFIGSDEVAYLSAACHCFAFHPPSRSSMAPALVEYLAGAGPLSMSQSTRPAEPATAPTSEPARERATEPARVIQPVSSAAVAARPSAAAEPARRPVVGSPAPATLPDPPPNQVDAEPPVNTEPSVNAEPSADAEPSVNAEVSASAQNAADWDHATSLFDGAENLRLTAHQCDLRYWFANVPTRTLRGNVVGYAPEVSTPSFIRRPGPLHDALKQEVAFRALAEERAARAIGYLVACAPDSATMEFYATQLLDETRHAMIFRNHLRNLGVSEKDVPEVIEQLAAEDRRTILTPIEDLGLPIVRDKHDFIGGVVLLTVLVEGFLAPSFELSERKWRPLDPVMADMEKGAGIDEVRHLAVGTSLVREHLRDHPEDTGRLLELVQRGMAMFLTLPVYNQLGRWEELYQQGLADRADIVGDYEIWPGRRLVDTTPQERIQKASEITNAVHRTRVTDMGLGAALS
jgi:alkylation response protein AidB-like acyl-CoA dehydrogenase